MDKGDVSRGDTRLDQQLLIQGHNLHQAPVGQDNPAPTMVVTSIPLTIPRTGGRGVRRVTESSARA